VSARLNDNSLVLVYEQAKSKVDDQFDSVKSIDTKSSIILTFAATITAFITSNGFDVADAFTRIGILGLVLAILSATVSLLVRDFQRDPDPRKLYTKYASSSHIETLEILCGSMINNYEKNRSKVTTKAALSNASFCLLGMSTIAFILGKIV